jgi:transposase
MNTKVLGIDIAKTTFQLHGVDGLGKAVLKKRLSRNHLAAYVANLPGCLIVMESCGGANYWARVFQRSGHTVKLISLQFVKPFVKTNENDADAKEIVNLTVNRQETLYLAKWHEPSHQPLGFYGGNFWKPS